MVLGLKHYTSLGITSIPATINTSGTEWVKIAAPCNFFFPALRQFSRGDDEWAKIVIEASMSYFVQIDSRGPNMEFRSLSYNDLFPRM